MMAVVHVFASLAIPNTSEPAACRPCTCISCKNDEQLVYIEALYAMDGL